MELTARPAFDPLRFETFRFVSRGLSPEGRITLRYALDDAYDFVEEVDLPIAAPLNPAQIHAVENLLALLHWVSGVSYFKTAAPSNVACEQGAPTAATATFLEALYSEGLGEFAYRNGLPAPPRPRFPRSPAEFQPGGAVALSASPRVLVPIGGGKDSIVALETLRRARRDIGLFSLHTNAEPAANGPIARTAAVASLPHLVARRRLDSQLHTLNREGALNGHIPITAIVTCVALLTAALNGFDVVAMANERSASRGNFRWGGIDVNHQFSKSLRAEQLLRDALESLHSDITVFSLLRPMSELAIARVFATLTEYHQAFTSCNAVFRTDATARLSSWCCDCPKCRFVFLILAPFTDPAHLISIFGCDLLAEERQLEGFAALAGVGAHKPFECVGEEEEVVAAIQLLSQDPKWSSHIVVSRMRDEVLAETQTAHDPLKFLTPDGEHTIPESFLADVRAIFGS